LSVKSVDFSASPPVGNFAPPRRSYLAILLAPRYIAAAPLRFKRRAHLEESEPMTEISPRRQPAEWAPHNAVWIGWPSDASLWEENLGPAQEEVAELISAIAFPDPADEAGETTRGEHVHLAVNGEAARVAAEAMRLGLPDPRALTLHDLPMGDIWLRDTGPIFTTDASGAIVASGFRFNGWGEKYDLGKDRELAEMIAERAGVRFRRYGDFVCEGGALEVDGEGTVITTRQCLLNANRNPGMTERDAEAVLKAAIGAEQVIWLDEGLLGDHTDGHVDNLARFIAPGIVVCMRPNGDDDPNAEVLNAIRRQLEESKDAGGRKLEVITIPSPGRAEQDGEIVPASHMNFYIANHSLIMPSYGGLTGEDESALECLEILEGAVDRPHFYAIDSTHLLSGGGSFHCISQQQPKN
jgi:agmatine deiminase